MSGHSLHSNNSRMQSPSRYTTLVFTLSYFPPEAFFCFFVFLFLDGVAASGCRNITLSLPNGSRVFFSAGHLGYVRWTTRTDHYHKQTWTSGPLHNPWETFLAISLVPSICQGTGQPSTELNFEIKSNSRRKTLHHPVMCEVSKAFDCPGQQPKMASRFVQPWIYRIALIVLLSFQPFWTYHPSTLGLSRDYEAS